MSVGTDLSNLPEDVREAIESGDACMVAATSGIGYTLLNNFEWKILRDYILRVTAERDALAKRIADAPVGVVELCYNGHAPAFMGFAKPLECGTCADIANQRVALLKVE